MKGFNDMRFFKRFINKLQTKKAMSMWLFFYILVFLFPVIVDFISFQSSEHIFATETKKLNDISMSADRRLIDGNIDQITSMALQLSGNDILEKYSYMSEIMSPEQIYALSTEADIWNTLSTFSGYIKNAYVFFPTSGLLYYNNRMETPEIYFSSYYRNENFFDYKNWNDTVLLTNRTGLKLLSETNTNKTLFYVVSNQEYGSNRVKYNIIIEFNLNALIDDLNHRTDVFFMCLPNGEIICSNNYDTEIASSAPIPSSDKMTQEFKINDVLYIVSQIKSQSGQWFYRCITPKQIYHSAVIYSHRIRLIAALISIFGGIILIIWAVYSSNQPLHKLIKNIDKDYSPRRGSVNEYNYINELFVKNVSEKAVYEQYVLSNKQQLKQITLSNLIDDKKQQGFPFETSLSTVGIDFHEKCFIVMLFYISDCSNLFFETYKNKTEAYLMANTIITNISTEIISQFYTIELIEKNEMLFGIINFRCEQEENIKEHIHLIFDEVKNILNKEFNISLLGAISDVKNSIEELPIAYNEAVQSIEYLLNANKQQFIYYEDIEQNKNNDSYPYSNGFEMQIINNANMNHHSKNRTLIDTLFNNNAILNNMSYQMMCYFSYDIIGTFVKIAVQQQNQPLKEYLLDSDILSAPTLSHALLQKLKETVNHCLDILESTAASDTEVQNSIYDDIKDFVDCNFKDPNINVNSISDHFHINASQLSAQFKKRYGIGLLSYIAQKRINMAKVMLTTTDMPIKQISAEIGYNSQQTFLRVFSKSENISPQKYRQTFLHEKK